VQNRRPEACRRSAEAWDRLGIADGIDLRVQDYSRDSVVVSAAVGLRMKHERCLERAGEKGCHRIYVPGLFMSFRGM
jgi:hypothetical protein